MITQCRQNDVITKINGKIRASAKPNKLQIIQKVLKEQFCLVLNLYVYVGDVSGDTSPIIWQRVMVGQQIICTNVRPAWKYLPKRRQHKHTGSRQDKTVLPEHSTT